MADVSQIKLPNGSVYDLIDEKSGYITAEYIENKTDYEIPVSRVGEIVVGETAIGTDSTNFPTSKAVVDYVDERVVQEMDAIDVGVTGIKADGRSLTVENGIVNIPGVNMQTGQAGLVTSEFVDSFKNYVRSVRDSIPTSTSQLTNDSGFVTTDEKLAVSRNLNSSLIYEVVLGRTTNPINAETKYQSTMLQFSTLNRASLRIGNNSARGELQLYGPQSNYSARIQSTTVIDNRIIYLPDKTGTIALTSDIPTVPTNISSFTNDSGYLTASDIASVMTYKGTKANYAALPSTGNTTGDVWHLTDTGAEWAWDGSAWQELGTAIDLSGYATKATTLAGYGITDAKIQNGVITLGNNTMTPLTSITVKPNGSGFTIQNSKGNQTNVSIPIKTSDLTNDSGFLTSYTETDPTVPSWAKASSKPSYGLTEISGTDDLRAIEALTGTSGLLKKTAANTWTLDTNTYLTSYTETDPTVPSWAKQSSKPTYTAAEVGALPDSTVIPSKVSDLTNDSGFISSYTETDPVFSASAAAGITSTDINNWNGKSDTDEKVKSELLSTATICYPVFSNDNSTTTSTLYKIKGFSLSVPNNSAADGVVRLELGYASSIHKTGAIRLFSSNQYGVIIQPKTGFTAHRNVYLQDKDGTIALTSDIPTVYSSTNTGGYLTMATLPIYDGTVE